MLIPENAQPRRCVVVSFPDGVEMSKHLLQKKVALGMKLTLKL
jgi:hypothetical protein